MGLSEGTPCDRCGRAGSALRAHGHANAGEAVARVAQCDCGWRCRVPWPSIHLAGLQDAAIEAHWQAVEVTHVTPGRHTDADLFTVLES